MENNDLDEWYRLENRDEYENARDYMDSFAKKDKTLYSNVIYSSFPRRGDLPIVSQDFTYTMDIMYMTTLDTEDDRANLSKQKIQNRRSTFYNIRAPDILNERNDYPKEWWSILVFVETTLRKAFTFLMKYCFGSRDFLEDCGFRIARLLFDKGNGILNDKEVHQ